MTVIAIDAVSFHLNDDFDFSFIKDFGEAFVVFDKQDSGNLCFGVRHGDKKLFLKLAGAATVHARTSPAEAIERLKSTVTVHEALRHPALIDILEHRPIPGGYLTVFEWFDGVCMGRQYDAFERFMRLPLAERLGIYDVILKFHRHVNERGYVAIDFYDGCIMYNFDTHKTMICDIEFYAKKPYYNPIGRMWGSSQHMSPEEFVLGAAVDDRSNVFVMGAEAFQLMGGGRDRSLELWTAPPALHAVAAKAISPERDNRYPSIDAYIEAWNAALSRNG